MNTRLEETRRWLDAEKERAAFSQWALEGAPEGQITLDLVDFSAVLIMARYGKLGYANFGLPRESLFNALNSLLEALPPEHQVWIETMERAYEKHLDAFTDERAR